MSSKQAQYQKAIDQINVKPAEEIDFTQHQLENGYTISTQERVVKEVCIHSIISRDSRIESVVGASAGDDPADGRSVLFARRPDKAGRRVLEESFLSRGEAQRRACAIHHREGDRDLAL